MGIPSRSPGSRREVSQRNDVPQAHTAAYVLWGLVGVVELVLGAPQAASGDLRLLSLLLVLSAAGNLIVVRAPGGVVLTMQGPVALAAVWMVGWPATVPMNLASAVILTAAQRASPWRAAVYVGNATTGMAAADFTFRALAPGVPAASPAHAGALLVAGAVFALLTGVVVFVGRFLDSWDQAHLQVRRWGALGLAAFVLYVPLSGLMATALRAGSGGALLAVSVWVLASLAVKGFADSREANRRLEAALRSLEEVASTDPLTGLFNRRRFDDVLGWECQRACRSGRPVSLLLADLQGLKRANDRFGHQVGDALLRAVGTALRGTLRATDLAFRLGGDEFAVLLPDTGSAGAALVAQAVVDEVDRTTVAVAGQVLRPRLTVGTATCPDDASTPVQLVLAADLAMYRARAAGRRVAQASGPLAL